MNVAKSHKSKLIPEDFWVNRTDSPLVVLAESHHLLLMYMQFVTFFSNEIINLELPQDQPDDTLSKLKENIEIANSVIKAVEKFMNVKVRPSKAG
jgi:hypothetical protein